MDIGVYKNQQKFEGLEGGNIEMRCIYRKFMEIADFLDVLNNL